MNSFALRKNATFEWKGAPCRIRELTPDGDVLVETLNSGGLTIARQAELLADYAAGLVTPTVASSKPQSAPAIFSRPLEELPSGARAQIARRLHYLRIIHEAGTPVFTPEYIKPLITSAAEAIKDPKPPSVTAIYRWSRAFANAKSDSRVLVPRYDRRGPRKRFQEPRSLDLLSDAMEDAFKASPKVTVKDIHARWETKIKAANKGSIGNPEIPVPNLRTAYRLVREADSYTMLCLKEGKASADRRLRMVKHGARSFRILERIEIDHTPLDLFLIDERTWLPLGRPTLTMAIEHFSRMPYGYYLSFGDPSAAAVVGALRHGILPKTLHQSALPNLPIEHDWPVYGMFETLVTDNGLEFHGIDIEGLANDLGFVIVYCPKRQPRFKGVIERYLKTINYYFAHQLPGTSMARFTERGDYDPQKHAILTLGEFQQIFEKWMLDVYAETIHRGIKTTPRQRWREGLAVHTPELPDLTSFLSRIGRSAHRKLRKTGIELFGNFYSDDALSPMLMRFGEGVTVRVVFDPENLAEILVWSPEGNEPVPVRALDFAYANGLSHRQHELIRRAVREAGASTADPAAVQRARAQIAGEVEALMESRKVRTRRKSAAIRGISSSAPQGVSRSLQGSAEPASPPPAKLPEKGRLKSANDLPTLIQPFQIKRVNGGGM
jgi:putative transposase